MFSILRFELFSCKLDYNNKVDNFCNNCLDTAYNNNNNNDNNVSILDSMTICHVLQVVCHMSA